MTKIVGLRRLAFLVPICLTCPMSRRFAKTPEPPYYAVIFSSQRQGNDDGYSATAARMAALAATQPGYLGEESSRDPSGFGITVSYWESEDAIHNWKLNAEHSLARERGRNHWYSGFDLRIARVERAYGSHKG